MKVPQPLRLSGARLLDFDGDIATWVKPCEHEDRLDVERVQMVEPIIERNKRLQNDDSYKAKGIKQDWWHFASWPNVIIEKWMIDYGICVLKKEHYPAALKKLRDPEWKYLRTAPGRVG